MIRSMTGYGNARRSEADLLVEVDIRSVNNRFFDFQTRLPRELQFLEGEVQERVRKALRRGRVTVQINCERTGETKRPRLDPEALQATLEALDALMATGKLEGPGSAASLLSLPDLFHVREQELDREVLKGLCLTTLDEALAALLTMREREGEALGVQLGGHLERIDAALSKIEAEAPTLRQALHENLQRRIQELLADVPVDPQRLAMEAAVLADRADTTEELVRLRSHLDQFTRELGAGGEVSKRLGFLLQEFLREANTIGSKAQALAIIQEVLLIKEETEKLREQIQNLE